MLKAEMPQPHGLRNNGNTCYFNATLQNLYRTIVFRKNLYHIYSALWRQENEKAHLVNESTSSESSVFAKVWGNVKQLVYGVLHTCREFKKYLFHFLAFLVLYKVGSSGIIIYTARWILVQPQFIRSSMQKLPSNASIISFYLENTANCTMLTFQKYLMCPRSDQPDAIPAVPCSWLTVVLALSVCLFCATPWLRNYFSEALSIFSECGEKRSSSVKGWWSRGDKVILCSSGVLSYCIGHLMASTQPVYERLLERNPETLFMLFVMALSSSLLFYHLGVTEVLQSLFQDFRQHPDQAISVALAKLFRDIDSESERYHDPRSVLEAVCRRSRRFYGFHQQDSHELLRHLLDGVREEERNRSFLLPATPLRPRAWVSNDEDSIELKNIKSSSLQLMKEKNSLTLVDRVFGGHFRTVYTCENCSSPYCLYEAFLDISLPITLHEDTLKEISDADNNEGIPFSRISQQQSIEFWLKVFTRSENLGKQYLCSACNVSSTEDNYFLTCGKKQTLICDPPAILCIHVKRFRKTADDFVKANDHVEFSEYLNLKPYLTNDCRRLGENKESVMYALFGVVVHSGSLEGGHYTAYIKSQVGVGQSNIEEFLQQEGFDWDSLPTGGIDRLKRESQRIQLNSPNLSQTKEWYYCSDSTVTPVDASDVFKQGAYLLFYERLC